MTSKTFTGSANSLMERIPMVPEGVEHGGPKEFADTSKSQDSDNTNDAEGHFGPTSLRSAVCQTCH
jgi:hypothetical protein